MAWDTLQIDPATVKGVAYTLLIDHEAQNFDETKITPEKTAAAKQLARRKILDPKVGHASELIERQGGVKGFLDALSDLAATSDDLQDVLAHAFVHIYAWDYRNAPQDMFAGSAEKAEDDLESAVRVLMDNARYEFKTQAGEDVSFTPSRPRGSVMLDTGSSWR